ncbi:hypothetical protein PFJ87_02g01090 [Encephalitozoon hellem]|uniref:Uncharacterized protein n=1 Tax=Encephalitozoon hellem TaxID=27973 RepID=A0ABY8CGS0_ENCHE|nr:hypothetical protein PFJ87_02g01090 [Encephalitozoon hellem]
MTMKMVFITTVFVGSLVAFIKGLHRDKMLKVDMSSIKEALVSTGNGIMALGRKTAETFTSRSEQDPT